jgi:hypothetical protein
MANSRTTLPISAEPDFSSFAAKLVSRETIALGEQALQACEQFAAGAAAIIRDNRQLMQTNNRIRKKLDSGKPPRNVFHGKSRSEATAK